MKRLLILALLALSVRCSAQFAPIPIVPYSVLFGPLQKHIYPNFYVFDEKMPEGDDRSAINHKFDSVNRALASDEQNADLLYQRGLIRKKLQSYMGAKPDFDKAWRLGKRSREFLMDYGDLCCYLAQKQNSITCFNIILKRDSTDAEACLHRGIAKLFIKETKLSSTDALYRESIPDFSRAIRLRPNYTEALTLRAFANYHLGFYRDAIPDLELALAQENARQVAYQLLGDSYLGDNRPEKACEVLKTATAKKIKLVGRSLRHSCGGKLED